MDVVVRYGSFATAVSLMLTAACGSPTPAASDKGGQGGTPSGAGDSGGARSLGGSSTSNKISSSAGGTDKAGASATGSDGTGGVDNSTGGTTREAGGARGQGGSSSILNTGGMTAAAGGSSAQSNTGGVRTTGGTSAASSGSGGRSNTTSARSSGGTTAATSVGGPSGGVTSGGLSSTVSGSLALSGLKIEPNPKNVLSCFVSWTTDKAADSVVQFGASSYEWEISDSTQVTTHRVLVIGMHASQAYLVKAISTGDTGSGSAEGKFTTSSLPVTIPVADITAVDKTKMQSGWTLMNIQKGDGTATAKSKYPAQAVMYDADGQPVWYYIDGTTGDRGGMVPVELTDKGVLIGAVMDESGATKEPPREVDFAGNTLWECSTPLCGGTGTLTHHASKLPNGNYIILRDVTVNNVTAPVFEEITSANTVVWSLDYRKLVPPPSTASGDWCHGNSITVDMANDAVYANCRFVGLIKTTYKNPTLKWHMAASFNGAALGDIKYSPTSSQYSDTHDPEIHDDGTILFFDNGGWSGVVGEVGNPHGYHSRAVEYKVDETAKTATLVWEFPGTFNVDSWYKDSFYLPFWGDADRLPNGNVLITAGVRGTTVRSRIFEVTKQDGKVVWEFQLPADFGVYRSERLVTPPLVHAIAH